MVLQLDPEIPLVYRSPTMLQFGISRPIVVVDEVDAAIERMVLALRAGVSRSGLDMIARSSGAGEAAAERLVQALAPVLRAPLGQSAAQASRVAVCGVGHTAERTAALLASQGLRVEKAATASDAAATAGDTAFAVIVGHFVVEPELHGLWLRRDVPHLPVVLSDAELVIGPTVEPGVTACLYCLNAHATDRDEAWPAMASQLWGRLSPADTELHASEVAAIVTRLVLGRLAGGVGAASAQLVVQAASGSTSERWFAPHPHCGCLEAGVPNARALTGSGSVAAALPRDSAQQPTTERGALWHA